MLCANSKILAMKYGCSVEEWRQNKHHWLEAWQLNPYFNTSSSTKIMYKKREYKILNTK